MTLKERLYRYLKSRPGVLVPSGELQRLTVERTTYTAQNAGRRLREMAQDGEIQVDYIKGHAHYSYQGAPAPTRRIEIVDGVAREIIETV